MLCDALLDYVERSIKSHKLSIANGNEVGNYHQNAIDELKNGNYDSIDYKFYIEEGRKYHKIVMDTGNQLSVHAFVDRRLVKFTNQHHSNHLQSTSVLIF